jgi:hypothetical protein
MTIGFKAKFIALEPVQSSEVPNGALFIDSDNGNKLTNKNSSGISGEVSSSASSNPLYKSMITAETFTSNKPLAKQADGRVVLYDSDDPARNIFIGFSTQASLAAGSAIVVVCVGQNIAGILTTLGFTPGEIVYAGETPGSLVKYSDLTGGNDTVTQLGIADTAAGTTGINATDLIFTPQVIGIQV